MSGFQEAFDLIDRAIEQHMEVENIPGLALALTDHERTLRASTYGYADLGTQTPVSPDHLFEIGSIGKSFTSVVLLQLHEEGRIDLDKPVKEYLPWFEVRSTYEPVTLHHLMTHTSGLIAGTDFALDSRYGVWGLRDTEAGAPPGEHFYYSNVGYKALGFVLQEVLGQGYGPILQARVLDPLGMAATDPEITHRTRKRLATGYRPFYDDRPAHPVHGLVPATWLETNTADGSVASTAGDMAFYLRMLINRGQGPGGRIISGESFKRMTTFFAEMAEGFGYGYGLGVFEIDGYQNIEHGGDMVGYSSLMRADMDHGLGVILLANVEAEHYAVGQFVIEALRAVHNGEALPDLPERPDPTRVENAADYAGTYTAGERTLTFTAQGERLMLRYQGEGTALEKRTDDAFYADHPDFALHLLHFGREDEQVVEVFYGEEWYTGEQYGGLAAFDHPAEWEAYTGHYRSYNPWHSNIRIGLRKGALWLLGIDGPDRRLELVGENAFRILFKDDYSPEVIRFDTVVNGKALRANWSLCDFYRTSTP